MTEGDSLETLLLDIAIAMNFGDVCRVCWYVVDRGEVRCCPGVRSVSGVTRKHSRQSQFRSRRGFTAECDLVARRK